jgi:hypothetical protein
MYNKKDASMNKFSKLVNEIGNSFSINVSKLIAPRQLKVYRLGFYTMPVSKIVVDLSEYFIDEEGDMYSLNNDTYFTKFGIRLKQLSNGSYNQSGKLINTFRDVTGRKVTIDRQSLRTKMLFGKYDLVSFDDLPVVQGNIRTKNFSVNKVG